MLCFDLRFCCVGKDVSIQWIGVVPNPSKWPSVMSIFVLDYRSECFEFNFWIINQEITSSMLIINQH